MNKKYIYLSRHAETNINEYFKNEPRGKRPKISQLTATGKEEAKQLGIYLSKEINPEEKILFLISGKKRTKDTLDIVLKQMNRKKEDDNTVIISDSKLNETMYLELTKEPKDKNSPEWELWKSYNKKYEGNFPPLKRSDEIGKNIILIIKKYIKQHPNKTCILILHGYINYCLLKIMLKEENISMPKYIGNCSIVKIKKDNNHFSLIEHIPNEEMN